MNLILFRHGIAQDRSADLTDSARQLTDEGVTRTRQAAAGLAAIAPKPGIILSSPKVRAMQTAQLAADAWSMDVVVCEALASDDVPRMLNAIAHHAERTILIVGHEPDFSEMIETLVFGRATGTVDMKKAGAGMVEWSGVIPAKLADSHDRALGVLRWLATPKMLRKLG